MKLGTAVAFVLCACLSQGAQALQQAGPDSTAAAAGSLLLRVQAQADSLSQAAPDSADSTSAFVEAPSGWLAWLDTWDRTLGFTWQANYDKVTGSAEVNGGFLTDGGRVDANYRRSETDHRQQDRDASNSNLLATWDGDVRGARSRLSVTRLTLEDITRTGTAGEVRIANEVQDLNAGVAGRYPLNQDFSLRWGVNGRAHSDEVSNRGNRVANDVIGGTGSTRWVYEPQGPTSLVAHFSYDRVSGEGTLRAQSEEAKTTQDTVGAKATLELPRVRMSVDLMRTSFVEDRLDWRRNSSGIVDTTTVPPGEEIFGEEREQREKDSFSLNGDFQLLPLVSVRSNFTRSYEERSFAYSAQGIVLDSRNSWQNALRVDYIDSGWLELRFDFHRDWVDRRTVDDAQFRGKEIRQNGELAFTLHQPLFSATDFELRGQQRLEQDIFEDPQNNQDRDRFTERLDGTLSADPYSTLTLTASGHLSRLDDINMRSERIGNNKEERLYEVRGGYTWIPSQAFTVDQVYRMQIVFRDYHLSNDRDEFNKQGQFNTKLKYARSVAVATTTTNSTPTSPTIEFGHSVNFRQNGRRTITEEPVGELYTTTQRRYSHIFSGTVTVPVSIWTFRVNGERGYLHDRVTTQGPQSEEDGRLEMQVKGVRSFRLGLITVSVDAQRVLAYGPRVRQENREYWVANSVVTVRF